MQYEPGKAPSPHDVAKATLYVLGDIIAGCTTENQPTRETVDLFLGLYGELKEPFQADDRIDRLIEQVQKLERGISGLTQKAVFR